MAGRHWLLGLNNHAGEQVSSMKLSALLSDLSLSTYIIWIVCWRAPQTRGSRFPTVVAEGTRPAYAPPASRNAGGMKTRTRMARVSMIPRVIR